MGEPTGADARVVHGYWRPGCVFCVMLRWRLGRTDLPVEWRNIWQDERAAAYVRSVADGNETVPVVSVAGQTLVNPSVRQVLDLVRERTPHLAPSPTRRPWHRRR